MVEIIAHRGASRECPENTLAAFRRALELGADGIELDVHATSDGVLVVHHDAHVLLPDAKRVPIAGSTAETLASGRRLGAPPIPTLDEVFDLVDGRATVYVEIKGARAERAVAECLARHPLARFAVHAFDHRMPVQVRTHRPGTPIGLLSASYPLDVPHAVRTAAADAWWQHTDLVDQALVHSVHEAGARLIVWTVNDLARARELVQLGVDALCTDIPGVLRDGLASG